MRQFIFIFFVLSTMSVFSQSTSGINGQLLDAEFNNEPLAFGTISIKGTIKETTTSLDGTYNFENITPGKYVLVYTFVGYKTQERTVLVTSDEIATANVEMTALKPALNKMAMSTSKKEDIETEASLLQTKS